MTSHSQHNNVEGTVAAEHNKRVSFGGEEQVQMIVYDDGVNDDYSINNHNNRLQQQGVRHIFTEPDAPPSRVRVHAEQAEIPRPISPPAQIAPVNLDGAISGGTPNATIIAASAASSNHQYQQQQMDGHPPSMIQMVNSPPLPSFIKRAEHDTENPFRPDEQLYHEVDPIVEMYRQRPFPPSPTHSPVPPHQPQSSSRPSSSNAQHIQQTTPTSAGRDGQQQIKVANGGGGGSGRHSSLAEARRETQFSANATQIDQHHQSLLEQSAAADGLGPPGHVEVVRLEKKKRGCCSLQ